MIAWTSGREGPPEVYLAGIDGGNGRRLSYWGDAGTRVCGWTPDGEVLAITAAGQPFRRHTAAHALPAADAGDRDGGGPPRALPFGLVSDVALETAGVALLTGSFREPAHWKRYRGGTAGKLWVRPAGSDSGFTRLLGGVAGQFASPMLVGGRLAFLSDYQGTGNLYSCALDGSDLRRHTDHDGHYARNASTDGQRIVYHCAGDVWLLDCARRRRAAAARVQPVRARRPGAAADLRGRSPGQPVLRPFRPGQRGRGARDRALADAPRGPGAGAFGRPRGPGAAAPGARQDRPGRVGDRRGRRGRDRDRGCRRAGQPRPRRGAWPPAPSAGWPTWPPAPDGSTRRGRGPRRQAAVRRCRVGRGDRRDVVRQRRGHRAGMVARLGLAGVVASRLRAAAAAAHGPGRRSRHRRRRHRRAVHRHRSSVHRGRQVPGVPVGAQLRPGVRRAGIRPVVPVRLPSLPGLPGGGDAVAVRAAARRPAGRRPPRGRCRGGRRARGRCPRR